MSSLTAIDDEVQRLVEKKANRNILFLLVSNDCDLEEFKTILRDTPNEGMAVMNFRETKIDRSHMDSNEFKKEYAINGKKALQNLFCYPIMDAEVHYLNTLISQGEWSLDKLYEAHAKRPYLPLHRFIG